MDTDVTASEAPTEEVAAAPPPAPNNSRAAWIVAGVMTAVALIAAMVAVSAVMRDDNSKNNQLPNGFQSAGFNRPVAGTITSIDGTSFKVKETAPNGASSTTTVSTSKDTTFRQSVSGALSDLAVGDTISVRGTTADNVMTATRITETAAQANVVRGGGPVFNSAGPQNGAQAFPGGGPRIFQADPGTMRLGEISKIEGDTVTLSAFDGSAAIVKTTSSTTYRINKKIALRNLKVGDTVRVSGPMSGSKVAANEVTKGDLDDALAS